MATFEAGQQVLVDRNAAYMGKRKGPEPDWYPAIVSSVEDGVFDVWYYISFVDEDTGKWVREPDIKKIEDKEA